MKSSFVLFLILFTSSIIRSQEWIKENLSGIDKKNGAFRKYVYECSDSYCYISLTLYKTNKFRYVLKTFNRNVFSTGKWSRNNDTLILQSFIQRNTVPVKLIYSNDTTGLINNFKIAIVRNNRGELMTDGMIKINSDSIQCLPLGGFCDRVFTSIDSIKVFFENGLTSGWIKVANNGFSKLIPVVQIDFLISSYILINRRYKISDSSLKIIEYND